MKAPVFFVCMHEYGKKPLMMEDVALCLNSNSSVIVVAGGLTDVFENPVYLDVVIFCFFKRHLDVVSLAAPHPVE